MKKVEAWTVYEFECPKCGAIEQLGADDFHIERIDEDNGDSQIAECAEFTCECGETFIVVHD